MSEIQIDLPEDNAETVEVFTKTTEQRRRWTLLDIQISPESQNITVRFHSAVNGKVVFKSRTLSIDQDPETLNESGFWIENKTEILKFVKDVLTALKITQVE